jgi:glycosyltransferase involved in cell wall biosynthesis
MEAVKDQLTLVRAFIHLLNTEPRERERLRLVVIGDGSLRAEARKLLRVANADHLAWLPGERGDIPEIMRALDVFVLPSLREGISNTILEAMASGLPVVATRIGGNPELVDEEHTGMLVPYANPVAMAAAIRTYLVERDRLIRHGQAGREKAETRFSMEAMIDGYLAAYDAVLHSKRSRYIRARFNVPFGR